MRFYRTRQALILVGLLVFIFMVSWAVSDTMCRADDDAVHVDVAITNSTRLDARITAQLRAGDQIKVWVEPAGVPGTYSGPTDDSIMLWFAGSELHAYGNSWVPQTVINDLQYRVENVSRGVGDVAVGMIVGIHKYQDSHDKPAPPPPPPAPPKPPEPPFDWSPYMIYVYIGVPILILFLIWLPLHLRYRRRIKRLAQDADAQADWGFDQYGIKTGSDL